MNAPAWNNSFVGDYRYGSAVINSQRYAVVWNGDAVERVRIITPTGNPVIWQTPEPLTDEVIAAISLGAVMAKVVFPTLIELLPDPAARERFETAKAALRQVAVKVRVFHNGKAETFDHTMPDDSKASLEKVLDHFEGQVGTVLTIHDASGKRLYKGMVEEWDLRNGH